MTHKPHWVIWLRNLEWKPPRRKVIMHLCPVICLDWNCEVMPSMSMKFNIGSVQPVLFSFLKLLWSFTDRMRGQKAFFELPDHTCSTYFATNISPCRSIFAGNTTGARNPNGSKIELTRESRPLIVWTMSQVSVELELVCFSTPLNP